MDKIVGIFERLMPMITHYPKWFQVIFTFCVGTMFLTIFFFIVLYPTAAKNKAGFVADNTLPDLTVAARRANRDYVIETATMFVNLDGRGTEDGKRATVDVRIVYTIFALNQVSQFDEGYHSMQTNVNIDRIRGSEPETELIEAAPTHKSWFVNTALAPGLHRTLVTGARYVYVLPLPNKRTVHGFTDLGPTDDAWCYPNEADIIGEFTIVIQSFRPIQTPKDGDMLLLDRSNPNEEGRRPQRPTLNTPDADSSAPYVLVAKWNKVMPGQTIGVRLSRDEKAATRTINAIEVSPSPSATVHTH